MRLSSKKGTLWTLYLSISAHEETNYLWTHVEENEYDDLLVESLDELNKHPLFPRLDVADHVATFIDFDDSLDGTTQNLIILELLCRGIPQHIDRLVARLKHVPEISEIRVVRYHKAARDL